MKSFFRTLWAGWKKGALKVARFQTAVLLTLFYFLILSPLGLFLKIFGWDPLTVRAWKKGRPTNWHAVKDGSPDVESLRRLS